MAAEIGVPISRVKLPDEVVHEIHDSRISNLTSLYPKIYVGTCTTAAATAAKTATVETFPLDSNNKPLVGTVVGIKFSNTNSAESATLNVNSTGAASIWYDAAAYTGSGAYAGAASRYLYFVWDGTYWAFLSWGYDKDADTNTVGYNLRINGLALPFKSKTYRYRLMFASPDNKQLVPANTSSSTDATTARTVNQDKINPFGVIWYYSYTSAISAGSTTTVARLWFQYGGITLGYSFNRTGAALTMTAKDPIYLKCAPQTDGSAIMDSTTPIVHALPSTEDGKIYILLGYAESETAMTLIANHPVYYYADGQIRLWTNGAASIQSLTDEEIEALWAEGDSGVATISFTITSSTPVSYQAESGMTWSDWVGSAYNTAGYMISGNYIRTAQYSDTYIEYSNSKVLKTDEIVEGRSYYEATGVNWG